MFYFGPVKGLTLGLDVRAAQGHYWHIYHGHAVNAKEPVVPYLRPHTYLLLCRWKKTDNISFTLCTPSFCGTELTGADGHGVRTLTWNISHRLFPHTQTAGWNYLSGPRA